MAWIADVQPQTTIRSVWGNGVRNQLVQIFADITEANSHLAALPDGALAVIGTVLHMKIAGAWRSQRTLLVWGANVGSGSTGNIQKRLAECVVPAGFATAHLAWDGTLSNGGGTALLGHVWIKQGLSPWTTLAQRDVTIAPGQYATVAISANYNVNAAGETPYVEMWCDFPNQITIVGQNMAAWCYG